MTKFNDFVNEQAVFDRLTEPAPISPKPIKKPHPPADIDLINDKNRVLIIDAFVKMFMGQNEQFRKTFSSKSFVDIPEINGSEYNRLYKIIYNFLKKQIKHANDIVLKGGKSIMKRLGQRFGRSGLFDNNQINFNNYLNEVILKDIHTLGLTNKDQILLADMFTNLILGKVDDPMELARELVEVPEFTGSKEAVRIVYDQLFKHFKKVVKAVEKDY
jgi:hypothetical protein